MKQLPNLYALRFILALLVILQHIPDTSNNVGLPFFDNSPIFHKGGQAVLYFFTLSGFLIIRIIFLEINSKNTFNFKNFYLRRVQRLYPVYYLVLFSGFLFYNFFLPSFGIDYNIEYPIHEFFLGYILLIPNVITHYYKVGGILNVLWSIGVEEQFYLFAPLLIYIGRKNILFTLIILLLILLGISLFYFDFYSYKNYYFYFVCGGLFAVFFEKFEFHFFKRPIIHVIAYIIFILSFITNYFTFDYGIFYHYFNMLLGALVISLITYYPKFEIKIKSINYFGKISYGIYMYHMFSVVMVLFFVKRFGLFNVLSNSILIILINILCIFFSILLAHISYQYFEKIFYKSKF